MVALLSLTFFLWGLPEHVSNPTPFWFTRDPVPSDVVREGLSKFGLTPGLYIAYCLTISIIRLAACYLVGALLFWRKPTERLALLVAFFLVTVPVGDIDPPILRALVEHAPVRGVIGLTVETAGFTLIVWLLLLFPDGQFQPRWTRAVAACWFLAGAGTLSLPSSPLDMLSWPLAFSVGFIPTSPAQVGIYLGSVVLLQEVVRGISGQGSNLTIAAAALATAALVQPLRLAFGAAPRDETDLGRIQADLLAVVTETMQPIHASLWLRAPEEPAARRSPARQ